MRHSSVLFTLLGAVGLAGLLSACGSSDSPSASAGAGGASGSGSASASGTVTGFGSIFVNGKKFETNNVLVKVGDSDETSCTIGPPAQGLDHSCRLKKGMVVTVNGSFNGGQRIAASVRQKDAVEGLVQSVAADGLSLVVMGQTVLVDSATIFDGNFTPVAGDNVEVNGHIQPGGIIQATFIEKKLPPVMPEVRGFVTGHNDGTKTFKIGNLTVDYSTTPPAGLSDMPPPNRINWDRRFVEVKGGVGSFTPGPDPLTEGTLIASKVEPENRGVGNDDDVDEFEVEGFVTQVDTPNGNVIRFTIGTTPVQTTANTEFRNGTVDEIVVGAKMSAEGRLENGVLIAKHVKFKESVRLEGRIASINYANNTFEISIGLPNRVTVTVNRLTDFKATGGVEITDLNDLRDGNHVRVRGRVTSNNTVIATRIQLRSSGPDDDVTLQGPVQSIDRNENEIVILGVRVDLDGISHFESVSGTSMDRAAFLAAVEVNSLVKVKGRLSGAAVSWEEAELED